MRVLILILLAAAPIFAQTPPAAPPATFRVLYIDRRPTSAEVAAAETSDQPLEPTVYYLAPAGEKKKPEFLPLFLPFSRLAAPVTLPSGTPLVLFSKPDPAAKFAEIPAGQKSDVVAVLRASRDQSFRDAKVQVLDASGGSFPYGQMRVVNATDRKIAVKTLDPAKQVEPGGVLTFKPTPGRRDTVPVLAGIEDSGTWREIHSGATKVRANNRVLLLVSGQGSPDGTSSYSVEYLAETAPAGSQ